MRRCRSISATPLPWHANLPDDGRYLLIAAQSGRALAAAARRAGYVPLVADLFGDTDTLALAARHVLLAGDAGGGLARSGFLAALEALAAGLEPVGLICGAGFEDRADLLASAAMRWPLLSNGAQIVEGLKDPQRLAKLCEKLGLAHPTITIAPPRETRGWLVKQAGASGGGHVQRAVAAAALLPGQYFQREVGGAPVSVLFCGDGRNAQLVGFSSQWSTGGANMPFRYGGAVGPVDPAPAVAAQLTEAVQKLTQARRLRGLCSADFLVDDGFVWLLEINPRPGATLDIFDTVEQPLLGHHVEGCAGRAFKRAHWVHVPRGGEAAPERAAALVYADRDIAAMPALDWPDWCMDRQAANSRLTAGAPICTVVATGTTPDTARAAANDRIAFIKKAIDGNV